VNAIITQLRDLQETGTHLSIRSSRLLACSHDEAAAAAYVAAAIGRPHARPSCATCMTAVDQNAGTDDGLRSIVVGNEAGLVVMLDPEASRISTVWRAGGVPACMASYGACASGSLDRLCIWYIA
jgi:Ciliary BBSome complex subunit 1